ncbi:hypothetical protein [Saccharomonospora saliphila]|uniref:hypothetical protein n=1 Tax=Saccharomonospora saliphila TaxID=369829 RepID=UPI00036D0D8D|nr:hypothetical protein [Saccharomonospora saliphila]
MDERTPEMLAVLAALHDELGAVVDALRAGPVPVTRQHQLAARLIEAGEQLDEHADRQSSASNGHADGFGFSDNRGRWRD